MWIPKWYLENQIRQRDELERRIKKVRAYSVARRGK